MKIIFLDIDGVLNDHEWMIKKTEWLDNKKLSLIGNLCKNTGAKVVLSSNWRDVWFEPMFYNNDTTAIYWGHKKFADNNIEVIGVTKTFGERGDEIKEYLSCHPEVTNYVAIDDTNVNVNNLVRTNPNVGFVEADYSKAKTILEIVEDNKEEVNV